MLHKNVGREIAGLENEAQTCKRWKMHAG